MRSAQPPNPNKVKDIAVAVSLNKMAIKCVYGNLSIRLGALEQLRQRA